MDDDAIPPASPDPEDRQLIDDPYSTADYERFTPPEKPKGKGRVLIIILIIVLVIAAAVAVYWFLLRSKPDTTATKQKQPSSTAQTQPSQQNSSEANTPVVATQHYDSTNLKLSFDYPKDWTITDTAGSGKLTAVSPAAQLTDATGQTATGQITMTIRSSQQALPEFAAGDATAALASQKIAYTKPSSTQRGNTYVSFLRYASDSNSTGLDGVYITGDAGYQAGQNIPKADVAKVDPIVDITFAKCTSSTCTGATIPFAISSASWSNTTFSQPLMDMLKSLSFD